MVFVKMLAIFCLSVQQYCVNWNACTLRSMRGENTFLVRIYIAYLCGICFYPWVRGGIVISFVRRGLLRTQPFGYYINMLQQIEIIRTFNPSL